MSFQRWMKQVNGQCERVTGLSTSDFEDYRWRDAYDDGATPEEALEDFFDEIGLTSRYPELFQQTP